MKKKSKKKEKITLPIIRSSVDKNLTCQQYLDYLRKDFYFACGYCNISEIEASGISFNIDHYLPLKYYPEKEDEYFNLIYACQKCNRYKSDFAPEKSGFPSEYYIIRPDTEFPEDHYSLKGNELIAKTSIGVFNIKYLNLNRSGLKKIREIRERLWKSQQIIAFGIFRLKSFNIDNLPPHLKRIVFRLRIDLFNQQDEVNKTINSLIDLLSRSPIIDPDPTDKISIIARKSYLKEKKAIIPS